MTCYHPLKAYRSLEVNPETGKRRLTFNPHKALIEGSAIEVPCGQCIGCRLDRSKQWAVRCMHEAQMHRANCFITLTYSDQAVPVDYSVKLDHFQKFMKRLRKSQGNNIRFFACGEYGENYNRPHYHSLIFNFDFPDKKLKANRRGNPIYHSQLLTKLWPHGFHEIGTLTYKSAAYTARYCMKKIGGDRADDHYTRTSPIDGNMYRVASEFCVMSRRPGIGTTWFDKFKSDAFPSDYVIVEGRKHAPPRFYLNKLQEEETTPIKRARKRRAHQHREDQTKARLAVRERVQEEKLSQLKRKL